jgi:hypothetical protein
VQEHIITEIKPEQIQEQKEQVLRDVSIASEMSSISTTPSLTKTVEFQVVEAIPNRKRRTKPYGPEEIRPHWSLLKRESVNRTEYEEDEDQFKNIVTELIQPVEKEFTLLLKRPVKPKRPSKKNIVNSNNGEDIILPPEELEKHIAQTCLEEEQKLDEGDETLIIEPDGSLTNPNKIKMHDVIQSVVKEKEQPLTRSEQRVAKIMSSVLEGTKPSNKRNKNKKEYEALANCSYEEEAIRYIKNNWKINKSTLNKYNSILKNASEYIKRQAYEEDNLVIQKQILEKASMIAKIDLNKYTEEAKKFASISNEDLLRELSE